MAGSRGKARNWTTIAACIFIALVASIALSLPAYAADAADEASQQAAPVKELYLEEGNPLYGGEEPLVVAREASVQADELLTQATYVSQDEAVAQLKEAMANRQATVSISTITREDVGTFANTLFFAALEEDDDPTHGDYLRWVYDGLGVSMSYMQRGADNYVTYDYTIQYKTTAAQEKKLQAKVKEVLADLHATKDMSTDEARVRAIYDYICAHVKYDYTHVGNTSYKLQYTAYAALMNGTSVCQGYASLFYLMARTEGLSTRMIGGTSINLSGKSEGHAWNIVQVNGKYYNVDSTWDSTRYQASPRQAYTYYLKSDADMAADHTRGVDGTGTLDYTSSAFKKAYPVSATSYGSDSANLPVGATFTVAMGDYQGSFVVEKAGSSVSGKAVAGTVALTAVSGTAKSAVIPATVAYNGETFKVVGVQASAFKGATKLTKVTAGKNVSTLSKAAFKGASKLKTVVVKSTGLTKKSVKGSLKGSKVATVKVNVGTAAENKTYVTKYAKIFTEANAGKAVTVK